MLSPDLSAANPPKVDCRPHSTRVNEKLSDLSTRVSRRTGSVFDLFSRDEREIHLIKLKRILLTWVICRHHSIALKDIVDEGRPFRFGNELGPFDEGHHAKSNESR